MAPQTAYRSMAICSTCGRSLQDGFVSCPFDGTELAGSSKSKNLRESFKSDDRDAIPLEWKIRIIASVGAISAIGFLIWYVTSNF